MLQILLLSLAAVLAVAAVELKNLNRAILAFSAMSISLAAVFYMVGAHILAVFQVMVYGGAVTVLMLSVLHTGEESG